VDGKGIVVNSPKRPGTAYPFITTSENQRHLRIFAGLGRYLGQRRHQRHRLGHGPERQPHPRVWTRRVFQTELWNSGMEGERRPTIVGAVVKFGTPTVANGEVYVGTLK